MTLMRLLEIVLVVLLLRALFPVLVRFIRGGRRRPPERFKEEPFDKKKMDIEDGEYKEMK